MTDRSQGIVMPRAQVTFIGRNSRARSFHGRFWSEMRNDDIIPGVAILTAKDNEMFSWFSSFRHFSPRLAGHGGGGSPEPPPAPSFARPSLQKIFPESEKF
jgi:hypothetical protein